MKLRQITRRAGREPLNALAIDSRRSLVSLDFVPRGFEGRRSIDLIHQTEPLASFDAVTQRRHHTVRPDRRFGPPYSVAFTTGGLSSLCSLDGTFAVFLRHTATPLIQLPPPLPPKRFCTHPPSPLN